MNSLLRLGDNLYVATRWINSVQFSEDGEALIQYIEGIEKRVSGKEAEDLRCWLDYMHEFDRGAESDMIESRPFDREVNTRHEQDTREGWAKEDKQKEDKGFGVS